MHDKVGTEFIVYMHVSASPLALTGATGAFVALEGLSTREICFTYEQRRSAASPDYFSNQEVKHRRLVFEPERGSGRSIGRDRIGEVGLLPHAQAQLGASCMGAARNALGTAQQSSLSGPARISKPTPGWSSSQLLVQNMGIVRITTVASKSISLPLSCAPILSFEPARLCPRSSFSNLGPSLERSLLLPLRDNRRLRVDHPVFTVRDEVNHRSDESTSQYILLQVPPTFPNLENMQTSQYHRGMLGD